MDKKLQAEYVIPGILVKSFAGLPVDMLNTAISHMRNEFTYERLDDLVTDIGDDDEMVIRIVVQVRTPGD